MGRPIFQTFSNDSGAIPYLTVDAVLNRTFSLASSNDLAETMDVLNRYIIMYSLVLGDKDVT